MDVAPSSNVTVNLNDAIEFSRGALMNTPTWRVSCRCFIRQPTEGYPEVVDL
jgi:hypothetical protein